MSDLTDIFEDKIKNHILDSYGCDFEEGWSRNIEFEFETSEYVCYFVGSFKVRSFYYDPGNWGSYSPPEESATVEVDGEVFYSPKDSDDENEKSEGINFEIKY